MVINSMMCLSPCSRFAARVQDVIVLALAFLPIADACEDP
jgi:hypothetical protein